jgi:hypothetical protein
VRFTDRPDDASEGDNAFGAGPAACLDDDEIDVYLAGVGLDFPVGCLLPGTGYTLDSPLFEVDTGLVEGPLCLLVERTPDPVFGSAVAAMNWRLSSTWRTCTTLSCD